MSGGSGAASRPTLSLAHAPPLRLVVAHFVAGAGCAAVGGGLFAAGFGDAHDPLRGDTLAVMHLWVVGWLSMTAVGVLLQFLPVTSGAMLFSRSLGWLHFVLHGSGVLGLAAGFLIDPASRFIPVAGAVLWSGLVLAALNLGITLFRRRERTVWRAGVLLALAHLVVTPSVGWILLLTFSGQAFLVRHHVAILVAHAHLGLGGWLFGLVVAVGGRLLPMFLVAPEPKPSQVTIALALLQAGLGLRALAALVPDAAPLAVGVLALAVAWWVGVMARAFHQRRKRSPDLPMAAAWSGLGLLALVGAAGVIAHLRPGLEGWGTYGLLAVAAGGLMTNGLLYRIVPFLVRLDRFRRLPGNPAVPPLEKMLHTVPARAQLICFATGFALVIADSITPLGPAGATGRWLIAAGAAGLAGNLILLVSGPPRWRALFDRSAPPAHERRTP